MKLFSIINQKDCTFKKKKKKKEFEKIFSSFFFKKKLFVDPLQQQIEAEFRAQSIKIMNKF